MPYEMMAMCMQLMKDMRTREEQRDKEKWEQLEKMRDKDREFYSKLMSSSPTPPQDGNKPHNSFFSFNNRGEQTNHGHSRFSRAPKVALSTFDGSILKWRTFLTLLRK